MDTGKQTFPNALTAPAPGGKIETTRWMPCPHCGCGKVLKVLPTTRCRDLVVYCKVCHKESVVNIP